MKRYELIIVGGVFFAAGMMKLYLFYRAVDTYHQKSNIVAFNKNMQDNKLKSQFIEKCA